MKLKVIHFFSKDPIHSSNKKLEKQLIQNSYGKYWYNCVQRSGSCVQGHVNSCSCSPHRRYQIRSCHCNGFTTELWFNTFLDFLTIKTYMFRITVLLCNFYSKNECVSYYLYHSNMAFKDCLPCSFLKLCFPFLQ